VETSGKSEERKTFQAPHYLDGLLNIPLLITVITFFLWSDQQQKPELTIISSMEKQAVITLRHWEHHLFVLFVE